MRITPKYFLILALMSGAAVVSASCASDGPSTAPARQNSQVAQAKLQEMHAKYDWIGKYHTDGLAYVYEQLAKEGGKPKTQAQMCKIIAKATKEFHKAQRHADVPANLVDPSLIDETCPADDKKGSNKTLVTSGTPTSTAKDLSPPAASLIDQIVAISASATSRTAMVNAIMNVEAQAASLPGDEAGGVIGVASVALSSLDYWEANLDKWVSLPATKAVAYSVTASDMTAATVVATAAPLIRQGGGTSWWQNPFVKGFGKVLSADAMSAARTIYVTWELGPIGWDAAAAGALFGSSVTALSLIF